MMCVLSPVCAVPRPCGVCVHLCVCEVCVEVCGRLAGHIQAVEVIAWVRLSEALVACLGSSCSEAGWLGAAVVTSGAASCSGPHSFPTQLVEVRDPKPKPNPNPNRT